MLENRMLIGTYGDHAEAEAICKGLNKEHERPLKRSSASLLSRNIAEL